MKELINVAGKLYKQLDDLQRKLASNLSNDDNETLIRAECFMLNIIKRKDNLVDLGEVFHNAAENPDMRRDLLYESPFGGYGVLNTLPLCDEEWSHFKRVYKIKRWAYLDDLLPKGDRK